MIHPSHRRPGAIALLAVTLAGPPAVALQEAAVQEPRRSDQGRAPSYPVAAEAEAFVARYQPAELQKDEVFVAALAKLARSDLSAQAKADAFALMQERIGWQFVGAARVFPGMSYARTVSLMLTTYFQYQRRMPEGLDVGPLLELSRTARAAHPLRASNALLLATILNREAAADAVRAAIDAKGIAAAAVPAIDLHNLAFAASLSLDPATVAALLDLLPEIRSEESREDLIAVTTIHGDPRLRGPIEDFVRRSFPGRFDRSVRTALIVLAGKGPPEHFREFYESLDALAGGEEDRKLLRDFRNSGFRDRPPDAPRAMPTLKVWDGFTVTVVDPEDGASITDGGSFRAWIRFK